MNNSLVAKVSSVFVIATEIAVNRWGGTEFDVRTQVIPSGFAEFAVPARYARLDRYTIACFEALHFCAYL